MTLFYSARAYRIDRDVPVAHPVDLPTNSLTFPSP